tara:strand:+ start:317 stop:625 length:309 start_codon:yes stop_codon:yes gene_type:complete
MICISTTSNSESSLKKIASEVLKNNLSPCTQILKIDQSGYIWEGEIVYKPEFKLEIKTIASYQDKILSIIEKMHNYKVFELSSYEINSLNPEYDEWFNKQLK